MIPSINSNTHLVLLQKKLDSFQANQNPLLIFPSTLQSEKSPKFFFKTWVDYLKNSLIKVFHFFKSCFSFLLCGFSTKKQNIPIQDAKKACRNVIPYIVPNVLPDHVSDIPKKLDPIDPFQSLIFETNDDGVFKVDPAHGCCILKYPEHFEKPSALFSILGTGGPFYWYEKKPTLERLEKEILATSYRPFEFLYYIFMNREMSKNVLNLKKNCSGFALNAVLILANRENPWNTLINDQSNRLEQRYRENPQFFEELIPGFCQLLSLNEKTVLDYVLQKNWKELILYVFKERTKNL